MGEFVTALTNTTTGLTASSFSSELVNFVPWFVIMIPLAFGIRLVFRIIKKAQHGRAA